MRAPWTVVRLTRIQARALGLQSLRLLLPWGRGVELALRDGSLGGGSTSQASAASACARCHRGHGVDARAAVGMSTPRQPNPGRVSSAGMKQFYELV